MAHSDAPKKGHSFAHEATPRCRWQGFKPPSVLHQRVASVVLNPTDFIQVHKNGVVIIKFMDKNFILQQISLGKKTDVVFTLMKDRNISIEEAVKIVENIVEENSSINGNTNKKEKSFSWKVFALIALLLFSALIAVSYLNKEDIDSRPEGQIVFERNWNELRDLARISNKNEISRDNASKGKDELLSQNKYITEWIGVVESVEQTLFDGAIFRVISAPKKSNATSYLISGISADKLSILTAGQEISFSGQIDGTDLTTIRGFMSGVTGNDIIYVKASEVKINN
jgi:hypothetical protein